MTDLPSITANLWCILLPNVPPVVATVEGGGVVVEGGVEAVVPGLGIAIQPDPEVEAVDPVEDVPVLDFFGLVVFFAWVVEVGEVPGVPEVPVVLLPGVLLPGVL